MHPQVAGSQDFWDSIDLYQRMIYSKGNTFVNLGVSVGTAAEREIWIKENTGKHFCQCGCGEPVYICWLYYYRGIPKYIKAHRQWGRKETSKVNKWIKDNQNKHLCNCGCGSKIKIRKAHYHRGIPEYIQYHQHFFVESRFWEKVKKSEDENGCWEWIGKIVPNGYGKVYKNCKEMLAHRLSYEITYGEVPEGLFVCHKCDNPPCVRPSHLFLGTNQDNMMDSMIKDRRGRKLNKQKVLEILDMIKSGDNKKVVADIFGITPGTIGDILRGKIWNYVTGIERQR
jgi:hypothetical protein